MLAEHRPDHVHYSSLVHPAVTCVESVVPISWYTFYNLETSEVGNEQV